MHWSRYKKLCDQPDYWSRWMLEQCMDLLDQLDESALRQHLAQALAGVSLEMPGDHRGPAATQMYKLALAPQERRALLRAIDDAAARGLSTPATRARGLGGFVAAWREYADYGT